MRTWVALSLIFCALPKAWSVADVELADSATVLVATYDEAGSSLGFGSGFFVTNDGHLLTNHHVVNNPGIDKIAVTGKAFSNELLEARIVWVVPDYDLAVIKLVKPQGVTPLEILSKNVDKGAQIWALGYPGKQLENMNPFGESFDDIDATLTTGIVSRVFQGAVTDSSTRYPLIQHTADISEGNSGGPLLDECGYVVGINTAKTDSAVEQVNDTDFFAVGSQGILKLLNSRIPGISEVDRCTVKEPEPPEVGTDQDFATDSSETNTSNSDENGGDTKHSFAWLDENWIGFLLIFLSLGLAYVVYRRNRPEGKSTRQVVAKGAPILESESDKAPASGLVRMSGFNDEGAPVSFAFEISNSSNDQFWIIGRSYSFSDYQIESQGISRAHVQLKAVRSEVFVRDLGSTNGTILNGQKLSPFHYSKLSIGDELQIATCTLAITT